MKICVSCVAFFFFFGSPTPSPDVSVSGFGAGVEMIDGPRLKGMPTHMRSTSERFEEAMEDGYMEVGLFRYKKICIQSENVFCPLGVIPAVLTFFAWYGMRSMRGGSGNGGGRLVTQEVLLCVSALVRVGRNPALAPILTPPPPPPAVLIAGSAVVAAVVLAAGADFVAVVVVDVDVLFTFKPVSISGQYVLISVLVQLARTPSVVKS